MFVKQLSVFIENREGRLEQVTEVLREENINILSLRMIVSNPQKAREGLRDKGFSAMLTDVLAVKLEDQVGELHKLTHTLCSRGLNIEYMYALASANRRAMIVKASDGETAAKSLMEGGLVLYSDEEMCY